MTAETVVYQGSDSEFYLIEQQLQETQDARAKHESIQEWVKRLQQPELTALYQWHYQLRFDPKGLLPENRTQFQQQVNSWLKRNK
jgi:hypothetical protein